MNSTGVKLGREGWSEGRGCDFTNYPTLRQWPFVLVLVDVAWGMVASAASAVVRVAAR
jgi:uncharacterized membrane protein